MNPIFLTKLDHTRINKSIKSALSEKIVTQKEADVLLKELDLAQLVESYEIPPDIVTMNSIVRIKFLNKDKEIVIQLVYPCLLYTSPSPRDQRGSRMPSSA